MASYNDFEHLQPQFLALLEQHGLQTEEIPSVFRQETYEPTVPGQCFWLAFKGELSDVWVHIVRLGVGYRAEVFYNGTWKQIERSSMPWFVGEGSSVESRLECFQRTLEALEPLRSWVLAKTHVTINTVSLQGGHGTEDIVAPLAIEMDALLRRYGVAAQGDITVYKSAAQAEDEGGLSMRVL